MWSVFDPLLLRESRLSLCVLWKEVPTKGKTSTNKGGYKETEVNSKEGRNQQSLKVRL